MKVERIGLDFDNVIYDLETRNIKYVKEVYGIDLTSLDINSWNYYLDKYPDVEKVWKDFNLYSQAEFFENAKKLYNELCSIAPVDIITASYPEIEDQKDIMIYECLSRDANIIHTRDKYCHTKNSVHIDDNADHVFKHVQNNQKPGLLFDLNAGYGWNKSCKEHPLIKRVLNYDELLNEVYKVFRK